jgi:hypothetical protein
LKDDAGIDEESKDPNVENHVDIQYWFPNNGNPTCSNSVFHSQAGLVDAMLHSKEQTLIFTLKNYLPDDKVKLPLIFPIYFSFGTEGIEEDRRTHRSIEECVKHYSNISLPMFQHPDIILVIIHMYFREKKIKLAYLKCMPKSILNGYTTDEHLLKIAKLEISELSKNKTKKTSIQMYHVLQQN